jgi:hypothetical protein
LHTSTYRRVTSLFVVGALVALAVPAIAFAETSYYGSSGGTHGQHQPDRCLIEHLCYGARIERNIGETVRHVQVRVEEISSLRRTLMFDCAAAECPRRATHQIEIQVDTAHFELPACTAHAELVRLGWRSER